MSIFHTKSDLKTEENNNRIKEKIINGTKEEKLLLTLNLNLNPNNFLLLSQDVDFDIRLSLIGNKAIPFKILQNMNTRI